MESSSKKLNLPKYLLTKGRSGGVGRGPMSTRDSNVAQQDTKDTKDTNTHMTQEQINKPVLDSATPANIKRKQMMLKKGLINSPTDSFLSPCSMKLFKRREVSVEVSVGEKLVLKETETETEVKQQSNEM